jgi:tetratricopeptide (TPR) repeat protein
MFIVLLVEFNQGMITISLLPSKTYELSKSSFFLIPLPAVRVLSFLHFTRDVRRWRSRSADQKQGASRNSTRPELPARQIILKPHFSKSAVNPNHVVRYRMGIAAPLKNPHEAIRLHQKALSLDSNNPEVLFSLAADYEEAKRYDDALKVYKEILSRDSSNLSALIRMRDLYQRLNQWAELYETQRQLLSNPLSTPEQEVEHRKFIGFKYEFGRSLLEAGDLERAKKIFRGVIKLDKDFIGYLGLGEVYGAETEGTAELWEKAYKMTSSNLLLLRLEDLYLKQGEPGKAIEIYKQAVSWKPQDIALTFFLGKLYYRLEMIDEAFDTLSSVDWGDKEMPDVHKLLGNIYLRRGSLGLAATEFKKALGFRKQIIIPLCVCSSCTRRRAEWAGRCPNCGKWNTFGQFGENLLILTGLTLPRNYSPRHLIDSAAGTPMFSTDI